MNKIITYIRDRHSQIYKFTLLFFSVAAIVYVLPKEAKFKYEITNLKGKPWHHENLIAPFDFAIKKPQDQLEKEKAEAEKNTPPHQNKN